MTQKQIHEYIIRYRLDSYICQRCGERAEQMAHRVCRSKVNYKKYGKEFIDNNINLVSVCSLECNDSFNIGNNPAKSKKLYEFYLEYIDEFVSTEKINSILEG